jgi:hypothetical protein
MPKLRMVAEVSSDELKGSKRSWVSWDLPAYCTSNVTSVNTILDLLGIVPKNGECFLLSVERAAEAAQAAEGE